MFCSKCGKQSDKDSKFCNSCGANLFVNQHLTNNNNNQEQNKKISHTKLSIISLCFLIAQFVMYFIGNSISALGFLCSIPWVFISLVLAIVSKCKNNDTMSLILIIIDSIVIVLGIIFTIVAVFLFASLVEATIFGCGELLVP